jgi:Rhodanese-like domain
MKTPSFLCLSALALVLVHPLFAEEPSIPNRLIDYAGFQKIVDTANKERESRRMTEEQFLETMNQEGVVLLDARSAAMYKLRHVKGAVNLPFTDFSAASLAGVVPAKNDKILIYCNNNFLNDPVSMFSKMPPASLNLSTYTSLKAYGYDHIYELGPLVDVRTTKIPFEGSEIK